MKISAFASLVLAAWQIAPALAAPSLAPHDIAFTRQAAIGGMTEIAEGQMAMTKGTSSDVKQFGQRMVDEHTANNQELQTLAQKKGATMPATLDPPHADGAAALNKLSGAAFDRAFIQEQIAGHQQMLGVMRTEIANAKDPDLKAFAQKTAQAVEDHLQMAQRIQGKL